MIEWGGIWRQQEDSRTGKIPLTTFFDFCFFFFSEILYLHKIGESTNTLLRRQNHYSTFSLNTGRYIDAKHRGLRYLHDQKKKNIYIYSIRKAGDKRTKYLLYRITFP